VWLARTRGAAVSDAERDWARALGFGGWLADAGTAAAGSELEAALQAVMPRLGLAAPARGHVARADGLVAGAEGVERWRERVRALTGLAAEAWGRELPLQLPVATRRWRLREYPDCVIGQEVVGLWARRHRLARGEAVVLGRAAVALGLMRHVAGEHDFDDAELFYELLDPAAGTTPPLAEVLARLRGPGGVGVADRSHHGRPYPACWVGSEGVASVVAAFGGTRAAARLALQRLMQLGFIEHVVHDQPLHDGHFFYRFTNPLSP
jgi:Domain found in Dishevelled, Egl-10, and Pleckstrin (DEP)